MALDTIHGPAQIQAAVAANAPKAAEPRREPTPSAPPPPPAGMELENLRASIAKIVEDLTNVSSAFNRKLDFNYNAELGQMSVKVIDRETDKVIKEMPPEALLRVHLRIREAIGLLFDEQI